MRRAAAALAFAATLAPAPAAAQMIVELGPQATAVAADPSSAVAGGYAALRTLWRTRFALTGGVGVGEGGETAWRGELAGHFLLSPLSTTGVGAYVGGGAAAADAGNGTNGYVVLLVGLEHAPAASSGWSVEAALGGGVRVTVGWRWRRFPANWRFRR